MASLRAWAPEIRRVVILVDKPDGYFDPPGEDFDTILSEELEIPDSRWFHFKYTVLELSTAVKPYAASLIFERYGADRLLYFDPDIQIYSNLGPLLDSMDAHSFVLTPHLTAPLEGSGRPADLDILRSGSYNLGFIALNNCEESRRFLKWWQAKLYDDCVVDLAGGLFVDQRWVDLAPGMFEGVGIVRDAGLNVAYWNLSHRQVTKEADGYRVNGRPLVFFHFSGFDPDNPTVFSRHQDRFTLDDLGDVRELAMDYRRQLLENGYAQCKKWPYAYGFFANGSPIPDMGRPAHHEAPEMAAEVSDPFSDEGYRGFLNIWNQPLAGPDGKPTGVTRLAYRIYRTRTDVQHSMPDVFNGDLLRFLRWVLSSGVREHNLSEVFTAPLQAALKMYQRQVGPSVALTRASVDPVVNEKIIAMLRKRGIWLDDGAPIQIEALNQLIESGGARLHLSRLAKAIYESRPDLQQLFPDPCGNDGLRYLSWFLTYGAAEYRISEVLLSPLRTQWNTLIGGLPNPLERLRYRSALGAMAASLSVRSRLAAVRSRVGLARTIASVRFDEIRQRDRKPVLTEPPVHASRPAAGSALGINMVGYITAEMGVGESVRCAIRAAQSTGLPVAVKTVDPAEVFRNQDRSVTARNGTCPHPVNIFHVNADQSEIVTEKLGASFVRDRYNIGFWAWELEEFPDRWQPAFRLFHEIWTPSSFCQTAIARKSPIPVVRMPHAIHFDPPPAADRSGFGIPSDSTVFISVFDLLSILERKNPFGMIAAYKQAFAGSKKCHLILKVNHGRHRPEEMERIREATVGLPVTIIDETIDRAHVLALLQMADCLVSLHRSEGFGLSIAEAMYLAKPVIVTAYSGNMDFTNAQNAFLVDYDYVPVPRGCDPYDEGLLWAEPRPDSAVSQMRLVATNPDLRRARGAAGQDCIKTHFSPEAVGGMMRDRLRLFT
jgi:glycosyltransferase involved in cell wall biosynthesis